MDSQDSILSLDTLPSGTQVSGNTDVAPQIVVLYDNDYDGFGAYWALTQAFGGQTILGIPLSHGKDLPIKVGDLQDKDVYLCDFTFDFETMAAMKRAARFFCLIDHHASARPKVEALFGYDPPFGQDEKPTRFEDRDGAAILDEEFSAAMLAWMWAHATRAPALIRYIQDRDLWRWDLHYSEEINYGIRSRPKTLGEWDWMKHELEGEEVVSETRLYIEGRAVKAHVDSYARRLAEKATIRPFFDWKRETIYYVPTVCSSIYQSEIGHLLLQTYKDAPFALTYFDLPDERRVYSMRSRPSDEGASEDVGQIASLHGGGGHPQAAGFSGDRSYLLDAVDAPTAPVPHWVLFEAERHDEGVVHLDNDSHESTPA